LHTAAAASHIDAVRALLEAGADPDAAGSSATTGKVLWCLRGGGGGGARRCFWGDGAALAWERGYRRVQRCTYRPLTVTAEAIASLPHSIDPDWYCTSLPLLLLSSTAPQPSTPQALPIPSPSLLHPTPPLLVAVAAPVTYSIPTVLTVPVFLCLLLRCLYVFLSSAPAKHTPSPTHTRPSPSSAAAAAPRRQQQQQRWRQPRRRHPLSQLARARDVRSLFRSPDCTPTLPPPAAAAAAGGAGGGYPPACCSAGGAVGGSGGLTSCR
jgi:hypothetical protein